MAIYLVLSVGMSFRAASKVFVCIGLCLQIETGQPTHTTILNWTKKQGIGNFREKADFSGRKWILIADESIQFCNKKLLFVTVVPVEKENAGRYLKYNDLTPVIIKVSDTWKAETIAKVIQTSINAEDVAYAISDLGGNLTKAFKLMNITHIEDINHKFSWMMQKLFENNEFFKKYTKHLSDMRAKLSMSKYARIVPPNQRIMSRYMNLTPLFEWCVRMIKLLDTGHLTKEEKEIVSFLREYKTFVCETLELLLVMNQIQKLLKAESLSRLSIKKSLELFAEQNNENALRIKTMIIEYFHNTLNKMDAREKVICSSDIIESCFGKFKELVKTNKTVGISDLALCISALLSQSDNVKQLFEKVSMKNVQQWKKENVGETLFGQKMALFKKVG
ncbi:MAG: hypothetical protein LBC03_00180 [Nitrososphaerota archaeon]|jgi:hypothetical protein|nr:hypothetical protein [Nitrososphaerota archaeon]